MDGGIEKKYLSILMKIHAIHVLKSIKYIDSKTVSGFGVRMYLKYVLRKVFKISMFIGEGKYNLYLIFYILLEPIAIKLQNVRTQIC